MTQHMNEFLEQSTAWKAPLTAQILMARLESIQDRAEKAKTWAQIKEDHPILASATRRKFPFHVRFLEKVLRETAKEEAA